MRNKMNMRFLGASILLLIFGACGNPTLTEVDRRVTYGVRVYPAPAHGYLRFSEDQVPGGTYINIYANPERGYILKEVVLQPANGNPSTVSLTLPKYSIQINSNTSVTAVFESKRTGTYSIAVDPAITHGLVYPERMDLNPAVQHEPGHTTDNIIRITVIPEDGYDLVAGSLKAAGVTLGQDALNAQLDSPPYAITLPWGSVDDITIEARFERLAPEDLKDRAWKYLSAGQYDTAAALYESAYQLNKGDPELILYSTIAQLGNILIDPDVRSLLGSGSLYFSPVPSTLEDWVCDEVYWRPELKTQADRESLMWYEEYAATEWTPDDASLPKFYIRFSGFVKPFGDSPISQQPGPGHLIAGDTRPTREKFSNLIFWALISSYRSGFNPFLEKVNRYVFGTKFEDALARAATLPADAKVRLNPRLKEQFKLGDFYGTGDTFIGKPELDYLVGNLLMAKAAFEYLSVYDWTIDLRNWLMDYVQWNDGLDRILHQMFSLQETYDAHKNLWKDPGTVAKMLPLKNNFLQIRDARAMDRAKDHITRALQMTTDSMGYWFDSGGTTSQFTEDAQTRHQWAREGFAAAKAALNSGGVFYFPRRLPKSLAGARWPSGSEDYYNGDTDNRVYGLKVSKFFTPGVFTLTNLITTELGGRAPSLFKVEWYEDQANQYAPVFTGNYTLITEQIPKFVDPELNVAGTGNRAPYGVYSFEVNMRNLRELFPKGFQEFDGKDTALLYQVFPRIPLWPWAKTYFESNYLSARKLYEFYHKVTVD